MFAVVAALSLVCSLPAYSQTAPADLDRDGIPNISDPDVDNDGLLNGADRNIDGGTARSGPLSGGVIGDTLPNNSPQELDMDADGLADNALNELDIDGDGLADNALNETDIDGDGLADNAANETDMDGDGLADNAPNETDIDGDGLADNAANELDIDGDGLADNALNETDIDGDGLADNAATETDIDGDGLPDGALNETDIDGDGLADNAANETDIDGDGLADNAATETDIDGDGSADGSQGEPDTDGDGMANSLDPDTDGDGLANNTDPDLDGTGVDDSTLDILYENPSNPRSYANDASVTSITGPVDAEVRKFLQIPATDTGLRVRVLINGGTVDQPGQWNGLITGLWRYLSSDRIQLWARWCYPANDPSQLKIFVEYRYARPNYVVSEENRLYAGYTTAVGEFSLTRIASSPNVFIYWFPGQPVGFYYTAPNQQATGFAPPYEPLRTALAGYPNFSARSDYLSFSGNLSTVANFQGVSPVLGLLRTIRQTNLTWYGGIEATQIR
jgi:hypothetical protein